MIPIKNISVIFIIFVFQLFFISCSFFTNLQNLIDPKSKAENKAIWYEELRSIEPTDNIHYINGNYKNQYIQTIPEFIDSFSNDGNFPFAFYFSGGIMEEWILLAKEIDSNYVISFVKFYHGKVETKCYTTLSYSMFSNLMVSVDTIINSKYSYFNSPIYIDSILYKECDDTSFGTEFYHFKPGTNTFYPIELPLKSYKPLGVIYNNFCFSKQIPGVFINNYSKSLMYLNFYYSDDELEQNNANRIAQGYTDKLWKALFDFDWTQTY